MRYKFGVKANIATTNRSNFVDRGYRDHGETQTTVFIAGQKRGIKTERLKCSLKRREAIEPVIGHLKSDGLLGRNYLKGTQGDQMNVMLSCAGHNLRLILRQLRIFCAQIWRSLWTFLVASGRIGEFKSRVIPITKTAWQPAVNCG